MTEHLSAHPSFERLSEEDEKSDILHDSLLQRSEEAQKVERNHGEKYLAIFRRVWIKLQDNKQKSWFFNSFLFQHFFKYIYLRSQKLKGFVVFILHHWRVEVFLCHLFLFNLFFAAPSLLFSLRFGGDGVMRVISSFQVYVLFPTMVLSCTQIKLHK